MIKVKDLLSKKAQKSIRSASPADSVQSILEMMQIYTIRSVMVMEKEALIGIVSERDCALKVLRAGLNPATTTAKDIMTANVVTVTENDTVDECMRQMMSLNIRHLPVCKDSVVIGMVSVGDVVKEVISQQTEHITYLESYIKGHGVDSYS